MPRLLAALLFAAATCVQADPLKSAACGEALSQLDAARAGRSGGVDQARQLAARTCLGLAEPMQPRANRWAQPPISVPPPTIEPPRRPPVVASPVAPPPPVHIERPATMTGCDLNGCWTNDGSRLQRVGPNLLGPNGLCTLQGGVAFCQ